MPLARPIVLFLRLVVSASVSLARALAEDVVRYYAVGVASDGTFAIGNVAPGADLLLARVVEANARPAAWRADTRAALRRAATRAAHRIDIAPCQRAEKVSMPVEEDKSHR